MEFIKWKLKTDAKNGEGRAPNLMALDYFERRSYTVNYELSELEAALYASVTKHVVEEMKRADDLEEKEEVRRVCTYHASKKLALLQKLFSTSSRESEISDCRN